METKQETQMIDLFMESKASRGCGSPVPIMYRFVVSKVKHGLSRRILLSFHSKLLKELGFADKDKLRVFTDCEIFRVAKNSERQGFSLNNTASSRGSILFSVGDKPVSRENQDIIEYQVEKGVLIFKIKPFEFKIPEELVG